MNMLVILNEKRYLPALIELYHLLFVLCLLFHVQILGILHDIIPVLLFKQKESEQKKLNAPLNVAVIPYLKRLNLKLISRQWLVCCNDHNKEMALIKSRHGLWPAVLHARQDHAKMNNLLLTPDKQKPLDRNKITSCTLMRLFGSFTSSCSFSDVYARDCIMAIWHRNTLKWAIKAEPLGAADFRDTVETHLPLL